LNGDRRDDVVGISNIDRKILLALSPVTSAPAKESAAPAGTMIGAAEDFNGDGRTDLAVTSWAVPGRPRVTIYLNDGANGFTTSDALSTPYAGFSYAAADFNGDGNPDLAVEATVIGPMRFAVFAGRGDGTFAIREIALPAGYRVLGAEDFDGDGFDELLVHQNSVLLGRERADRGGYDFETTPALAIPSTYSDSGVEGDKLTGDYNIVPGDVTGSPAPELLTPSRPSLSTSIIAYARASNGTWTSAATIEIGSGYVSALAAANLDESDARDEVIVATKSAWPAAHLQVHRADGTLRTRVELRWSTLFSPHSTDVNGDGHLDVLLIASGGWFFQPAPVHGPAPAHDGYVLFLRGRGDGTFDPPQTIFEKTQIVDASIGDFNADRHPDFVLTTFDEDHDMYLRLFLGDGTGAFREEVLRSEEWRREIVFAHDAGDINGDGIDDLAVRTDETVLTVYYGTKTGLVESPAYYGSNIPYLVRRKGRLPAVIYTSAPGEAGVIENTCVPARRRAARR
jgi:FG-GAP-like repeat